MTIDFRVAVDWNDNTYINWDHTGADEYSQYTQPNLILGANFEQFTLTRVTLTDSVTAYGGDYVDTTAINSNAEIANAGSFTGQIVAESNKLYTMVIWLYKLSGSDNAQNLYIRAFETTASGGSAIKINASSTRTDASGAYYQHYVTFTTSATTERLYLQINTTTGGFVGQVRANGIMLVEGAIVPSSFNDGSLLLNELTSASFAGYTLTNCALSSNASKYFGIDKVQTTAFPTIARIADAGSTTGEIVIEPDTVYTICIWLQKIDAADFGNNLYIRAVETTTSPGGLAAKNSTKRTDSGFTPILHTVTIKTTATSTRLLLLIDTDDTWTAEINCYGLMVIKDTIDSPATFNDGLIKAVTHRVAQARWNVGYKTSIVNGSVANENRLECSLYNLDDYIDESKYQNVHRVYIEGSDDGGSTWTRLYTGWTRKWMPIFDPNSDQHLRFTAVSSRFYLDGIKARLPVQSSNDPLTIMIAIIGAAELPNGETITTGTPRPGDTSYTISYAGQNWTEEVDLLRALADTAWGDGRWTYFDRDDEYHGYSVGVLNDTSATSDFTVPYWLRGTADYRYADPWLNMVEMRVSPRKLSATSTARLWELPASVTVANGASDTILARFNDEDKPYQISARQVNIASQTWSAGTPTVTLNAKSTSAYIEITNSTGSSTTLTAMRINGQKIKTWDSFYEQLQYDTEITSDGNNTLTIPSELPDSVSRAQTIMQNWLDLYGTKHHRLWSVVVPGDRGSDSDLIDYSIGDVCSIDYPDGNTYKHVVIGEEWAWRKGGQYEKKLYLERIYSNGLTPIKPSP